ncbi:hypothetical protein Hanom_Chr07g00620401 [Helianthus anomalus]
MRKKAQEKKGALSSSPSVSSDSSIYSSITSNPTVDSMPMTETKERSFYDTGGLEMVAITNFKRDNYKMKSTATSVNSAIEQQDGYNSMDEIWKDITLLDDDYVIGTYSETTPSSIWDYSPLWMADGQEEIGKNMYFPDNKRAI